MASAAAGAATLPLILAGPVKLELPEQPGLRALGRVSDDVRDALLAHARALVMPSPFESLSLVVLEAWNRGTPVIVNARCDVLLGQVRRANGGLYYRSSEDFAGAVRRLADDAGAGPRRSGARASPTSSASTAGRSSSNGSNRSWRRDRVTRPPIALARTVP